jgi:hypothetical protein
MGQKMSVCAEIFMEIKVLLYDGSLYNDECSCAEYQQHSKINIATIW